MKRKLKTLGRVSLKMGKALHRGAKKVHKEMTSPKAKRTYKKISGDLGRLSDNYQAGFDRLLVGKPVKKKKRRS